MTSSPAPIPKSANAKMQPSSSGANRDSKTLTDVPADQFFKLLHLRAQAQSRAAKNGNHLFDLGLGDVWLGEWNIQDGDAPEIISLSSNRSRWRQGCQHMDNAFRSPPVPIRICHSRKRLSK